MIGKTFEPLKVGNKTYAVQTNTYVNEIETKNDLQVIPTINQVQSFINLIPIDFIQDEKIDLLDRKELKEFYNKLYLTTYKNIIKLFYNSHKNSIFTKTKQELGTTLDGYQILQGLNLIGVLNIQELKEQVFNNFASDPCLAVDTEPDPEMHPLKLQMVKANYYLSCRTHILDMQLRNLLVSSVFDNTELYLNDNSYINYCFSSFIERIKAISNSYYTSLINMIHKDLQKSLENGITITDPITNVEFNLTNDKQEDSLSYLKILFSEQAVLIMKELNKFMGQQITNNNKTFNLSKLLKVQNYFINNIVETDKLVDLPNSIFSIYYNVEQNVADNTTSIQAEFCLRPEYTRGRIVFISTRKRKITDLHSSFKTIQPEIMVQLKQEIIANPTFSLLFKYIFPLNKILNFVSLTNVSLCSSMNENSNVNFDPAMKTGRTTHRVILDDPNDCEDDKQQDPALSLGFDLEILKFIAMAPIEILKGIEETFDPNIFIANLVKTAAESVGAPDISIIPYSAPLMLPPPVGPSIMPIYPWGYAYWAISAGEAALKWSKNGFGVGNPDLSGSLDFKNPFERKC